MTEITSDPFRGFAARLLFRQLRIRVSVVYFPQKLEERARESPQIIGGHGPTIAGCSEPRWARPSTPQRARAYSWARGGISDIRGFTQEITTSVLSDETAETASSKGGETRYRNAHGLGYVAVVFAPFRTAGTKILLQRILFEDHETADRRSSELWAATVYDAMVGVRDQQPSTPS
ncbi:hypothetical protein DL96DRAFT_1561392 [Flagelloscypha sp. PMI_526]|nr:hypothetical protein DL96DRAFT_1561392 [Flagelloscypha sp. PMI_526]